MALGAYSLIRYSNHLNDQRINLGVVVWHPLDGFRHRFSPALERVQAIDPRIRLRPLKDQLEIIRSEIEQAPELGKLELQKLAKWFRQGMEVTEPYPAQISDVEQTLEELYGILVSPVPEIRRASTQANFDRSLKKALTHTVERSFPHWKVEDVGRKRINGVEVYVGYRLIAGRTKALWRALSLQAVDHPSDQITKAKATALDVGLSRELAQFKNDEQCVVVQSPKPKASQRLSESVAFLKHAADEVIVVSDTDDLAARLEIALAEMQ
jgi:hypothetical protein